MSVDLAPVAAALPSIDLGQELGRGAWGVVVSGRHRRLGRAVAIKQLPRAFSMDEEVQQRFVSEARLLAQLDHPHIVPIFDFVEHDGLCLLVMELLDGGTLGSQVAEAGGRLAPEQACATALAVAAALDYAHAKGVLHRDIKPENLMFSADGVLKVTDFGIAKVLSGTNSTATRTGRIIGTPAYIAPEQATGSTVTAATDVYALSTVLYEVLAGQLPYPDATDTMACLYQHVNDDPTPLLDVAPHVPPVVADVVRRGLARDPGERLPTARAFATALRDAGNKAFGPGWTMRAGVVLRDSERAVSREETGPVPVVAAPAAATSIVPTADVSATHASAPVNAASIGDAAPAAAAPASSRRVPLIAAAAAIVVILTAVAAMAMSGGGGGGDADDASLAAKRKGTTTTSTPSARITEGTLADPTATVPGGAPAGDGGQSTGGSVATLPGSGATTTTSASPASNGGGGGAVAIDPAPQVTTTTTTVKAPTIQEVANAWLTHYNHEDQWDQMFQLYALPTVVDGQNVSGIGGTKTSRAQLRTWYENNMGCIGPTVSKEFPSAKKVVIVIHLEHYFGEPNCDPYTGNDAMFSFVINSKGLITNWEWGDVAS